MKARNLHYKEPKELKTLSLLRLEDFPFSHAINPGPKSRVSFFLLSFLVFLFPCIVHYLLSGAQKTFLFPTPSVPPPNHVFHFSCFLPCFSLSLPRALLSFRRPKVFPFPTLSIMPQITHSFFLQSFLAFLFLCIVHCFLSSAQKTFLFSLFLSKLRIELTSV